MKIRRGNTAEVFDYDIKKVCKLFYQKTPYEYVQQEYENAQKLMGLGIRVPEPFEIVNQKGRYGIIYEKIHGEPIQGCMNQRHIFEIFIMEHKRLLDISSDVLMTYKDFLHAMIRGGSNGEISEDIVKKIQSLPDGNSVLHGDYHPGNVMITTEGEFVIIDLLNVCCGPREYDVARTFFLLEDEKWQDRYLKGMGYCREEIECYLEIIKRIRRFENKSR